MLNKRQTRDKDYDFDHPVIIREYRNNGLDVIFYTVILTVCAAVFFILLCFKDGKFGFNFTMTRVLLSFPPLLIGLLMRQLIRELRTLVPKLLKKPVWTMDEMMKLTRKDRKETERILTRVLESSFIVSEKSLKPKGAPSDENVPEDNGDRFPPEGTS